MTLALGYFAHGPWAHLALEKILADPAFEVRFVATRLVGDTVLQGMAEKAGLPFLMPRKVNAPDEMAHLASYGAEIFVSMSFDQIFRRPLLDLPPRGVVNCHAGALPFYRGRNILNWALINGENRFGVTVHYMDEGIDTGPIVRQDFVPIGPDDGYGDLLEKAYRQCADTLHAALRDIVAGEAATPQETLYPVGFYCGQRKPGDEWLDWRNPSADIHNFVRGITLPGPCARTRLDERVIAIVRTERVEGAPPYRATPGEVVGRDENGILVKTGDTVIRVRELAEIGPAGQPEVPTPANLPIGTRFMPWTDARHEALEIRIAQLEALLNQGEG